jgi:hypothetical protein
VQQSFELLVLLHEGVILVNGENEKPHFPIDSPTLCKRHGGLGKGIKLVTLHDSDLHSEEQTQYLFLTAVEFALKIKERQEWRRNEEFNKTGLASVSRVGQSL